MNRSELNETGFRLCANPEELESVVGGGVSIGTAALLSLGAMAMAVYAPGALATTAFVAGVGIVSA